VTWGHPETTGIPALDYYVSSTELEPESSDAEYSERLELFSTLPTFYYRPPNPERPARRQDFGFDDQQHLYVCPQLLFKLHPDFDQVLGDILRRDPQGYLVFLEGAEGGKSNRMVLFRDRFTQGNPDVADRLLFRPFQETDDFINLLAVADVLLDPAYFGGGNTTLESLSVGTPVVTWPGPFARGRTTLACFRRMGILDGVVDSLDEYAERAVLLATNGKLNADIRSRILRANSAVYEDGNAVAEMERFFLRVLAERLPMSIAPQGVVASGDVGQDQGGLGERVVGNS
jgi:predicted O-linked N-acetylglucosamine transferase (SPINDLY family)